MRTTVRAGRSLRTSTEQRRGVADWGELPLQACHTMPCRFMTGTADTELEGLHGKPPSRSQVTQSVLMVHRERVRRVLGDRGRTIVQLQDAAPGIGGILCPPQDALLRPFPD